MKLSVKVKPGSRHNKLSRENDDVVVRIKARAQEGKANEELVRFLAELLGIPKSHISIIGGHLSHFKRLELPDDAAIKLRELATKGVVDP